MSTGRYQECGHCGYSLFGLGQDGSCPECGRYFNLRTGQGLKFEGSPDSHAAWLLRRIRTVIFAVLTAMILCCSGASLLWDNPRWACTGSVILAVMLLATLTSYLYEKDEQPEPLNPQRPLVGKVQLVDAQNPISPPPVRSHFCRRCGQDLGGMPIRGTCCECGRPYDKGKLIGITTRPTSEARMDWVLYRHRRWVIWGLLGFVAMCAGLSGLASAQGLAAAVWTGLVLLLLGFMIVAVHTALRLQALDMFRAWGPLRPKPPAKEGPDPEPGAPKAAAPGDLRPHDESPRL